MEAIAAALLKMQNEGKNSGEDNIEEKKKPDMTRMFLNLGKLDKMGTNNMLDLLLSCQISKSAIGKIDIMEKFSFIEVDESYKDVVLETLNGSYYKKRKITIETANKRSGKKEERKRPDSKRPDSKRRNKKR